MARMTWLSLLLLLGSASLQPSTCHQLAPRKEIETTFKTEPTFMLEYFEIETWSSDRSKLAPGYLFIDPAGNGLATGPQIYEQDGTLVWYGGLEDQHRVQDFHVCNYLGSKLTHLCWSKSVVTRNSAPNRFPSSKEILDSSYSIVAHFNTSLKGAQPNLHEFNLVDSGYHYLQPVYPGVDVDLSPYGGSENGVIWDGCFQEIDVSTGEPRFQWCALEHIPLWETTIWFEGGPNTTNITTHKAGGGTYDVPFDPYHLNAIDKDSEGNYIISCRHLDQIIKVAGADNTLGVEPGTVLWKLGGKANQFQIEGEEFTFSKQHHVRSRSLNYNETIITFLDNAWEGTVQPSNNYSSGLMLLVNNATMTVKLLKRFKNPDGDTTPSQASMQMLPNDNAFIGWGALPQFSEFSDTGSVLFHAVWSRTYGQVDLSEHSYRTFKSPWVGKPSWSPKLVAYSRTCFTSADSPLVAWVSWNGATEVKRWEFFVSTTSVGPWAQVGIFDRTGFETEALLLNTSFPTWLKRFNLAHVPYVSVSALDAKGNSLGSTVAKTFVPKDNVTDHCDARGCFLPIERYNYTIYDSCGDACRRSLLPAALSLILLLLMCEYIDFSYLSFMSAMNFPYRNEWSGRYDPLGSPLHGAVKVENGSTPKSNRSPPLSFEEETIGNGIKLNPLETRSPSWAPGHRQRMSYDRRASDFGGLRI